MSDDDDFMSVQTGGGGSMKPSVTSHGRSQRKRELEQTASAQVEPDDIRKLTYCCYLKNVVVHVFCTIIVQFG